MTHSQINPTKVGGFQMLVKKEQVTAMIDYSNIEIHKLIDSVGCCEAETNHWIDQFYKMLKENVNKLEEVSGNSSHN